MGFSLIECYRARVLNLLDSIVVKNKYKYLVVDEYTNRLIDNVLTTNEILRHDVSAIERIEDRRQVRGSFEAIYILSPQPHIVDCLIADYSRSPPRYGGAHICFVPMIEPEVIAMIYNSPVAPHIRAFNSLMIDFFPRQSNVFTFNDADSLPLFYNPSCLDLVKREVLKIARKLVSVCVSVGEYPLIRYYNPPPPGTHNAYTLPYLIATTFQRELDEYARANKNFPSVEPDRPQSVFLVLDRTVDLCGPFLHELTYEAMAHDLLFIENGDKYTYQGTDDAGKPKEVVGTLSEDDDIWTSLRHEYMADVPDSFGKKVAKFSEEHPELGKTETLSEMKAVLLTARVVNKAFETLKMHESIIETILELFNRTKLQAIVNIEQSLATALTSDGKRPKTIFEEMVPLLDDQLVSTRDRVRIIGLYLLYRNGIIDADFRKLCYHAKLSETDMKLLKNMDLLGAHVIKSSLKERSQPKKPTHRTTQEGELLEIYRYVSPLKDIIEGVVHNSLDLELFKHSKDQPVAATDLMSSISSQSVTSSASTRRNRAVWHDVSAMTHAPAQRIFVFVAGGMTYAESRIAYEISRTHDKEVIIGSADFVNPSDWLDQLSRLRAPRGELRLKVDQPAPQMPAYLLERDPPPQPHGPARANKPTNASAPLSVPATAPHKLSRNTEHHHHKAGGNPPGHFDVEKKKTSKLGKLFK